MEALRHYWLLAVVLLLIGGGAGYVASQSRPVTTTAESRLAVGSTELAAYQVPGFAAASQQLAVNYARYIGTTINTIDFGTLGPGRAKLEGISASPVPSSSIIRLEIRASDPDVATRAADIAATQLRDRVNNTAPTADPTQLLNKYAELSQTVANAQVASDAAQGALSSAVAGKASAAVIAQAQAALAQAKVAVSVAAVQQSAAQQAYLAADKVGADSSDLSIIGPAIVTGDDASSLQQRYVAAGAVAGLLLALLLATTFDRVAAARRAKQRARARSERLSMPDAPTDDHAAQRDPTYRRVPLR